MTIEPLPPNEPRFGLIVALFAVAVLVVFVCGYFTLGWDGKRLVPRHHVVRAAS
jgi:hypothetical protein